MDKPKLSILFWFYKDIDICINRLEQIQRYNPGVEIHGLYGGDINEENKYRDSLHKYLDSFYTSPSIDTEWKWIHGDLMILDWYDNFGKDFDFDSLVVIQWDMLIFDSIGNQFKDLKRDELYLSGLRILDEYTEKNWEWTKPDGKYRNDYDKFMKYVGDKYLYHNKNLPCCLFVLEVIPKKFFDMYHKVENKELGMLEYKIPIYAEIFSIKIVTRENEAHWWANVEEYPLNAEPIEIKKEYIKNELKKEKGWRIFHPYFKKWLI